MRRLKPFIRYYGSKWRLAPLYPAPEGKIIIEPFAGSAQYSTLYPDREVHLYDLDEKICGVWDYLIHASKSEIMSLPLLLDPSESVYDYDIPQEAKWLIGYWLNAGSTPVNRRTGFAVDNPGIECWSLRKRTNLAASVEFIRHWKIQNKSYEEIQNTSAVWFVDPPYQKQGGQHYRHNNRKIDFQNLKEWVLSRKGLKIVCEGQGAEWMDFTFLKLGISTDAKHSYKELIWTNYQNPQLELWR